MKDPTSVEIVLRGQASTGGLGWGRALVVGEEMALGPVSMLPASMAQAEIGRFQGARSRAAEELKALANLAHQMGGVAAADIVQTQLEILFDPELNAQIVRFMGEGLPAQHALERVFKSYIALLEETGNSRMMERTSDLRDIRDRMQRLLNPQADPTEPQGNILIGHDITPTELIEYAGSIVGAVMARGGATSHAAIIAASLGIPLVMGLRDVHRSVKNGDLVVIDGERNEIVVHPHASRLEECGRRKALLAAATIPEIELKPAVTRCGTPVAVRANVELEAEIAQFVKYRPEGIGLVRTESLLLWLGTEEAARRQESYYEAMATAAGEFGVTVRLLDVGGDKLTEHMPREANPYLGWRGARVLLARPQLLDAQLDALLRVSGRHPGKIRVMLPMVTTLDEWRTFRERFGLAVARLSEAGVAVDPAIPVGLMVEVPSVAMRADVFAAEVDFLSIGTNDLTQYMLAVDRGNPMVADLYDTLHPAVLHAVKITVDAATAAGKPVSVCGEAAGNPMAAACFIGLGVTELSMQAASIPKMRRLIVGRTLETFRGVAASFLAAETRAERERLVERWMPDLA